MAFAAANWNELRGIPAIRIVEKAVEGEELPGFAIMSIKLLRLVEQAGSGRISRCSRRYIAGGGLEHWSAYAEVSRNHFYDFSSSLCSKFHIASSLSRIAQNTLSISRTSS